MTVHRGFARSAAFAFVATVALRGGTAKAGGVAAQLDYVPAPACPNADAFETTVSDHLGYSPFRPDAIERVEVRIETSGRGLEGRIEWRNAAGRWAGDRTFPSRTGDCAELVRAMGFAVALQFQLMAAAGAPTEALRPPAPPTVAPMVPPTVSVAPSATRPREPASTPTVTLGAGAVAGVGLSPGVAALGRLFGSVAWPHFGVEISAEASLPATMHRTDRAGFDQQVLLAGAAACGVRARWSACLLGKVGEMRVAGEGVDTPETASGVFIQSGLRLAVTQNLGRAEINLHGDGLAALTRGIVTLDSMPIWTTPRVAGALGIDLAVRFR